MPRNPRVKIIIVGAGPGGLSAGIAFKRQLDFHNFNIYEQSNDIGGTWHDNTYPGCGSDTDVHWYSLSTDLNPYWKQSHASQPELKAYWKGLAAKYSLQEQLRLNTRVTSVDWNNKRQLYRVTLQDLQTKRVYFEEAQVVISATGLLSIPFYPPELSGVSVFKGPHFHAARWDDTLDLRNKRVAVFGNGCSGWQIVPAIAKDPSTQVVNFCRTPSWTLGGEKIGLTSKWQWIFAHVPLVMRIYRGWIMTRQEWIYLMIHAEYGEILGFNAKEALENYIKSQAPPEYHQKLIPEYPVGCKRIVVDNGYLSALHLSNVDVNFDGVAEFTEDGLVTKTGETFQLDVIVQATGFTIDVPPLNVRGANGITIQEFYDKKGGPEAYLGTTIPGFPNFYMICGPNAVTGHASLIFAEEVQINYMIKFIKPVIDGSVSSFEVTSEANDAYNETIQRKLSASVWNSGCASWYRTGTTGKIFTQWPGTITQYWWRMRNPIWSHYKAVGAEKWIRRRRVTKVIRGLGFVCMMFGVLRAHQNRNVLMAVCTQFIHEIPKTIMATMNRIQWVV